MSALAERADTREHFGIGGHVFEHFDHHGFGLQRQHRIANEQLAREIDVHRQAVRETVQTDFERRVRDDSQRRALRIGDQRFERAGGFSVQQFVRHDGDAGIVNRLPRDQRQAIAGETAARRWRGFLVRNGAEGFDRHRRRSLPQQRAQDCREMAKSGLTSLSAGCRCARLLKRRDPRAGGRERRV